MNKIALVTGASSGIGKNMVQVLLNNGYKVIGITNDAKKLHQPKSEQNENFISIQCDVSKAEQIKKVSADLRKKNLLPSFFFLSAGIREPESEGIDFAVHEKIFATNYFGVINWVREWLDYGVKTGATFICMSSVLALRPSPGEAGYCASKAALKSTFDSLRILYANSKATFITVIPGTVNTSMLRVKKERHIPFLQQPDTIAQYIFTQAMKKKEVIVIPYIDKIIMTILSWLPKKIVKRFFDKNCDVNSSDLQR